MKILQMCSSQSWGGMEMHVPQLASALRWRGHEVWVGAFPESPLFEDAKKRNLPLFSFPVHAYFQYTQIVGLARFIKDRGIQIIHSHYSRDLWTVVPALHWAKSPAPLFLTKHIGTQAPKKDALHKWLYARVEGIFANSEVIRKNVIQTHPVEASRVETLHLGIDLHRFFPRPGMKEKMRGELKIPVKAIVFAIAGRLQRAKGYFEFIEMAEAIGKNNPNVYFLLIGGVSRGEEQAAEQIRERAARSELRDRLIFTGFRPDIENVLQAADIFVFPSHAEAYGLVVLEAMALGLPVISSNCDGILDIVVDKQTGELVPPRDVGKLVQAARRFLENPDLRMRYGQAGLNRVRQEFDWESMVDKLLARYLKALKKK